ncbi:MAG: hypothetical protein KAS48_01700 [Gammaproteobacteria bacterium]|nr:hypothetical protein [Gammaproteobacteria bacterium]
MVQKIHNWIKSLGLLPVGLTALILGLGANLSLLAYLSDTLDTGGLVVTVALLLISHSLLLVYLRTALSKNERIFRQAAEILDRYSAHQEGDLQLESNSKSVDINRFIKCFNYLIRQGSANRALFSDVASSLAVQAHDLSGIANKIEQRMKSQEGNTDDVTTTIGKLEHTVGIAAKVANSTSEMAAKSESEGTSGKVTMTEAITSVMMLSDYVNETGDIIKGLGEDSKAIGGIIEVITGVAEQTNLLALNAAIEAARAGEQGRGFAVVADEVRSLASKTQESTHKIKAIINKLMAHVNEASSMVEKTISQAEISDEKMEGVTISYSEIVGYMTEINVYATNLSQTVGEEANSAAQAVDELNQIQEASNLTIEQSRQLTHASMELGKLGEQLDILVSGSKTSDASDADEDSIELF